MLSPAEDLSNEEREVLLDFALDGGKIMFLFTPGLEEKLPNFNLILSHFNLSIKEGLVFEDINGDNYYNYLVYLVPEYATHAITNPMRTSNYFTIVPQAGALDIGPEQSGITVAPLLYTSDKAYLEPYEDMDEKKNDDAEEGPFTLAVAVTKNETKDTDESQLIVTTNAVMFAQASRLPFPGNSEMFLNSVSWLSPVEDDFYIRGKSLRSSMLYFESSAQQRFIMIIVCGFIPLLAFAAALVVYQKRKNL